MLFSDLVRTPKDYFLLELLNLKIEQPAACALSDEQIVYTAGALQRLQAESFLANHGIVLGHRSDVLTCGFAHFLAEHPRAKEPMAVYLLRFAGLRMERKTSRSRQPYADLSKLLFSQAADVARPTSRAELLQSISDDFPHVLLALNNLSRRIRWQ